MLKGEFYCLCCMCGGLWLDHGYLAINLALIYKISFQKLALQFAVDVSVLYTVIGS